MGLALLSPASSARGQGSSARPVRFVVPYAPGGPTDGALRAISDRLSAVLGQPIVVENRSGGLGTIGAGLVGSRRPTATPSSPTPPRTRSTPSSSGTSRSITGPPSCP